MPPAHLEDGGSGDEFELEEYLCETVEEFRTRFNQLEDQVIAAGFSIIEEGVWPEICAAWKTPRYTCDFDDVEEIGVPVQIPIWFEQTYLAPIDDIDAQSHFVETIRSVFEPLADEGFWLSMFLPLHPLGWTQSGINEETGAACTISTDTLRAEASKLSTDIWDINIFESATSSYTLPNMKITTVAEVNIEVGVVISLVPRNEDGTYDNDPGADIGLAIPLEKATLLAVLAEHRRGTPLDDAVEMITGTRRLSY